MVQHGEMTPADAESEAKRLGLGPFASEPDPNDYSPMREPFWTLPMTVAWIAYRTEDAVRNWWDEYRKECFWYFQEWRVGPDGPVYQGHFLKRRSNATLVRLQMADAKRDVAHPMSVAEAIDVLWQALRSGDLDASGIDEDTGQRVPIPAQQWHDLTWFEERDRDVIRAKPRAWQQYCALRRRDFARGSGPRPMAGHATARTNTSGTDEAGGWRLHATLLRSTVDRDQGRFDRL